MHRCDSSTRVRDSDENRGRQVTTGSHHQLRALPLMNAQTTPERPQRTRSFRALLRQVLHLQESPQRTALAFAIGVFIAFSPAYGLHTAMVVVCTWLFGLNFVA